MPSTSSPSMPSMPSLSSGGTTKTTSTESSTTTTTTKTTEEVKESKAGYALTANTISSLSSSSDLSTLSSLLGNDSSTTSLYNSLTGVDSTTSNYNTNLLLTQILEKLNKIAEKQNSSTNTSSTNNGIPAENVSNAEILRFRLNSYDFLSSLSGVFISSPEKDGTFFVTGDRTYTVGNKQSRETFYMLFKSITEKSDSLLGNYSVAISVMQDIENPNSFLYKLSNADNVIAQKTGNLVSLRLNAKDLKADILISLE